MGGPKNFGYLREQSLLAHVLTEERKRRAAEILQQRGDSSSILLRQFGDRAARLRV
jgi:hypothetical protein